MSARFEEWVIESLKVMDAHLHKIMATQQELTAQVQAVTTELQKVGTETRSLLDKIDALNAIISAGGAVTPELQAAVSALVAQAQVVDDLVPDAAPPTP